MRFRSEGVDIEAEVEKLVSRSNWWSSSIPDPTAEEQFPYQKLIYEPSQRKYAQSEMIPDPVKWTRRRRNDMGRYVPIPASRLTGLGSHRNNHQLGREELFVSVRSFTPRDRWDGLRQHVRSLCISIGVDDEVARVINSFPNLTSLELIGLPLTNGHSPLAPDINLPKLQKLKLRGYLSSAFVRKVCNNAQYITHLDIGLLASVMEDQAYQQTLLSRLEVDDSSPVTAEQAQEFQQNGAEAVALAKKDGSGEATNECSDDEEASDDEEVDDQGRRVWPWALHAPIWLPRTLPSQFKSVTHLHLVKPYTGETSLGCVGTDGFTKIPHRYEQILCLEWTALLEGLADTLKEVILEHRVVQNCGDTVTDSDPRPQEKGLNLDFGWFDPRPDRGDVIFCQRVLPLLLEQSHSFKSLRRLVFRGIQVNGISTRADSVEVPGKNGVPNNEELLRQAYPDCDIEIFEDSYPIHIYAGYIYQNWSVYRRHLSTQDQGDGLLYDGSFYNDYKKRFGPQWKIVDQ